MSSLSSLGVVLALLGLASAADLTLPLMTSTPIRPQAAPSTSSPVFAPSFRRLSLPRAVLKNIPGRVAHQRVQHNADADAVVAAPTKLRCPSKRKDPLPAYVVLNNDEETVQYGLIKAIVHTYELVQLVPEVLVEEVERRQIIQRLIGKMMKILTDTKYQVAIVVVDQHDDHANELRQALGYLRFKKEPAPGDFKLPKQASDGEVWMLYLHRYC